MLEHVESESLVNTLLLCYHIHDTNKAEQVKACAARKVEDTKHPANVQALVDIIGMTNKQIHTTVNTVTRMRNA